MLMRNRATAKTMFATLPLLVLPALMAGCHSVQSAPAGDASRSDSCRLESGVVLSADDGGLRCPLDGYSLVWHDEFDAPGNLKGGWTYQKASAGWVNNELQTYVEHVAPSGKPVAECSEGTLKIHCFKEGDKVYSGRVYANVSSGWRYGYFEASIKLPSGKGTWPAFWMMPVDFAAWPHDGEIDIMEEVGFHANYTSSSIHCESYNHVNGTQKTRERHCPKAEGDFHLYALEWTENYIRTFVDGEELLFFGNDGMGDKSTWPFDEPFYLILNLAWGGNWGGAEGVDESALPVAMEIDFVRVFQKL